MQDSNRIEDHDEHEKDIGSDISLTTSANKNYESGYCEREVYETENKYVVNGDGTHAQPYEGFGCICSAIKSFRTALAENVSIATLVHFDSSKL